MQETRISSKRDIRLDLLKVLGLLCIILAHTEPPFFLDQVRMFDVPIMVIASGAAFKLSARGKKITFWKYIKSRFLRLAIPAWVFLLIFFSLCYGIFEIVGTRYPFSAGTILSSFALLDGIGYVWIIRVFILVAISAPILRRLYDLSSNHITYFIAILAIYALYELLHFTTSVGNIRVVGWPFRYIIFYILPYSCLFGLGYCLPTLSRYSIVRLAIIFGVIFGCFMLYRWQAEAFWLKYGDKYPPHLYYMLYGSTVTIFLYCIIPNWLSTISICAKPLIFMSSSSMWIYLWHIFFLSFWQWLGALPVWAGNFAVEFVFILLYSTITVWMQRYIFGWIIGKLNNDKWYRHALNLAFLK